MHRVRSEGKTKTPRPRSLPQTSLGSSVQNTGLRGRLGGSFPVLRGGDGRKHTRGVYAGFLGSPVSSPHPPGVEELRPPASKERLPALAQSLIHLFIHAFKRR